MVFNLPKMVFNLPKMVFNLTENGIQLAKSSTPVLKGFLKGSSKRSSLFIFSDELKTYRKQAEFISSLESIPHALGRF